jgi:hypothetical protein
VISPSAAQISWKPAGANKKIQFVGKADSPYRYSPKIPKKIYESVTVPDYTRVEVKSS